MHFVTVTAKMAAPVVRRSKESMNKKAESAYVVECRAAVRVVYCRLGRQRRRTVTILDH